jgi:hypothetical protein
LRAARAGRSFDRALLRLDAAQRSGGDPDQGAPRPTSHASFLEGVR